MDSEFRTTFIPKRPVTPAATAPVRMSRPMGILTLIGFLLVLVVLVMAGGLWIYRGSLQKQVAEAQAILADTQKFFEPTVLNELKTVSRRIAVGKTLLANHAAVSPFLSLLSDSTLPQVRFSRLDLSMDGERPTILLSGEAEGYRVIAQQSRVFGQYGSIRDHLFSNFVLTPKGRVSFDLAVNPDPRLLTFRTRLAEAPVQAVPSPSPVPAANIPSVPTPAQ